MLNFLNGAVLVAAAAALLPFLLHLFSKRKVKVVKFSSIVYLKAMQKRQVRAIKIKQILLLIIRTLILLAIVMAFARPATESGFFGSHAAVSAVIVLDNSASMGLSVRDGRLFDIAVRKGTAILAQMEQADEAALIVTSGQSQGGVDLFGNPVVTGSVLEAVEPTDVRSDLTGAINRAIKLISERKNLNREIYIISDFQASSLFDNESLNDFDGSLYFVELPGDEIDNCSIVAVDAGDQLIEVGTEFDFSVTIKCQSEAGIALDGLNGSEERLVSLYLDDERISQQGYYIGSGESKSLNFRLSISSPGYHDGFFRLSDDDLKSDNDYFFSFYLPENFNILLVGDDAVDTRLFRLALAPDEKLRRHWSVKQVSYGRLGSIRLVDYDAVILSNFSSMPAGEAEMVRLSDYVRRGGGLMVNSGRDADSATFNKYLSEMTGVELASEFPTEIRHGGFYRMSDFDLTHQILSVFDNSSAENQFDFKSYARLKSILRADSSSHLLARYSDGSPALVASKFHTGRVIYFGCDISPEISDISMHPFFVPFMVRSCEYLSADFSGDRDNYFAGDAPRRTLRRAFNIRDEFEMIMPDGTSRLLKGGGAGGNDLKLVECGPLNQTGIYSIRNGGTESDRVAVNIDPAEGDLYRIDLDEFKNRFSNGVIISGEANMAGFISEKRYGRELWQYFLVAAIFLLALEMLIARDRVASSPK